MPHDKVFRYETQVPVERFSFDLTRVEAQLIESLLGDCPAEGIKDVNVYDLWKAVSDVVPEGELSFHIMRNK